MPLNDLSLDELNEMALTAATLARVGDDLLSNGLTPTFDLSPGKAVTIRLDAVMPEAPGQATKEDVARVEAKVDQRLSNVDALVRQVMADNPIPSPKVPRDWHEGEEHQVAEIYARNRIQSPFYDPAYEASDATGRKVADIRAYVTAHLYQLCDEHLERLRAGDPTPSTEAAPSEPALEPVDPPPADEGPAGGDPQSSAAPSRSADVASPPPEAAGDLLPQPETAAEGVAEDSGGGQEAAAPASPAAPAANTETPAPIPGSASALAASTTAFRKDAWTPEEDARLIDLVVNGMQRLGLGKYAAIRAAAEELGRPVPGTEFRCKNALRARLDAALAAATPSPEAAAGAPGQGDTAGEGATPPAVQSPLADPVTAHLMGLTDKGGWTLDRDLELMELSIAGWAPNEIALQIQMQAGAIKPRFDALTGLYTDASDKKQRRFSREAVFEALTRLTGKAA